MKQRRLLSSEQKLTVAEGGSNGGAATGAGAEQEQGQGTEVGEGDSGRAGDRGLSW